MSGQYARKVARYSREDRDQRRASRQIEPILDRLRPGANIFSADDFRLLVTYFLGDDIGRRDQALAEDRFWILSYEIKCERKLTPRTGVTVSAFAQKHGLVQSTIWRRVHKAGFKSAFFGGKKLYYIKDLESLLCARKADQ